MALLFFTLAVMVGFSHSPLLVAVTVFGEALILLILNRKLKDEKIMIASMLLNIFAGTQCIDVDIYLAKENIWYGVYMGIIVFLSTLQIYFLRKITSIYSHVIRVVHMIMVATGCIYIDALLPYEYTTWLFFCIVFLTA